MATTITSIPTLSMLFLLLLTGTAEASTFTFVNKCGTTVWPGVLSNSGSPQLETTGFELQSGGSRSFQAPAGWSGRFWARTGCAFDASGHGSCATGDCGSGSVQCNGAGAAPPATLAEFTLAGPSSSQDFYDVSLVDGYNVPMVVDIQGGSGACRATGCAVDINGRCPAELKVGEGDSAACRSACEAFGTPEYCCSGAYSNPNTCRPSSYSQLFKTACPQSYSYAYDDATSTFTCSGADYSITFCPESSPSLKSASLPQPQPQPQRTTGSSLAGSSSSEPETVLQNDSWLASLATGAAAAAAPARTRVSLVHQFFLIFSTTASVLVLFL